MLKITLNDKEYTAPFVPAIALREIKKPMEVLKRAQAAEDGGESTLEEDLDTLTQWFCLLFGHQFSQEDLYLHYPADRIVSDIALAVLAVQGRVSEALAAFPMKGAAEQETPPA